MGEMVVMLKKMVGVENWRVIFGVGLICFQIIGSEQSGNLLCQPNLAEWVKMTDRTAYMG